MDVAGAVALLPLAAPTIAELGFSIKITDKSPPIFRQTRYTADSQPFTIFKLRTMPKNTTETPSTEGGNDLRATKIGRVLRKNHLDELPQIFNVLKGDMALVGPRPPIAEELPIINDLLDTDERNEF